MPVNTLKGTSTGIKNLLNLLNVTCVSITIKCNQVVFKRYINITSEELPPYNMVG